MLELLVQLELAQPDPLELQEQLELERRDIPVLQEQPDLLDPRVLPVLLEVGEVQMRKYMPRFY